MSVLRVLGAVLLLGHALAGHAEQMQRLGAYEAHYSLIPTMLLKPAVADGYGIRRARDRALLNVAIIDPVRGPVHATVTGTVKDLLGNVRDLTFREVAEGEAVYYLLTLQHTDREVLRFSIDVRTPDAAEHRLEFQQKVYWEDR